MDIVKARHSDPGTSHDAMSQYDTQKMESAIDCVVRIYREFKRLADFELRELFGMLWGYDCSRHLYQQARSVARDRGFIVPSGKTIVNPESNRKQIVWEYCSDPVPVQITTCPTCGSVIRRKYERKNP